MGRHPNRGTAPCRLLPNLYLSVGLTRAHGRRRVEAAAPKHPEDLPLIYAAWRRRTLIGVIVASAVGQLTHGPMGEIRYVTDGEQPSAWLLLGLAALVAAAFGPALVGTGLALSAIGSWRRLGRSSRYARAAWILWVLGPLPVLLLPVAHLFGLNTHDALRTSATQVRYLVAGIAPALFALLPGILRSGLVLKRFLPESAGARPDHAAGGPGMHRGLPAPPGGTGPARVPERGLLGPAAHRRLAPRAAIGGPPAAPARSAGPGGPPRTDHRHDPGHARCRRGTPDRPMARRARTTPGAARASERPLDGGICGEDAVQQVADDGRRHRRAARHDGPGAGSRRDRWRTRRRGNPWPGSSTPSGMLSGRTGPRGVSLLAARRGGEGGTSGWT